MEGFDPHYFSGERRRESSNVGHFLLMFSFPYISLLPSFSLSSRCSSCFFTVANFCEICPKTKEKSKLRPFEFLVTSNSIALQAHTFTSFMEICRKTKEKSKSRPFKFLLTSNSIALLSSSIKASKGFKRLQNHFMSGFFI